MMMMASRIIGARNDGTRLEKRKGTPDTARATGEALRPRLTPLSNANTHSADLALIFGFVLLLFFSFSFPFPRRRRSCRLRAKSMADMFLTQLRARAPIYHYCLPSILWIERLPYRWPAISVKEKKGEEEDHVSGEDTSETLLQRSQLFSFLYNVFILAKIVFHRGLTLPLAVDDDQDVN